VKKVAKVPDYGLDTPRDLWQNFQFVQALETKKLSRNERDRMIRKTWTLFAAAAALVMSAASFNVFAQAASGAGQAYWGGTPGPWKSGTGLCWRAGY
jgi:hypothetical protein